MNGKKAILSFGASSIFIIIFNALFFIIGGADHPASVWFAYAMIHFAYLMMVATPYFTTKSKVTAEISLPLIGLSAFYLLAELAIGLIFMVLRPESLTAELVIQILATGIYLAILLVLMYSNEHTVEAVQEREAEAAYLKHSASRVKLLMGKSTDAAANKAVERVYDLIHAAPTKSTDSAKDLEQQILDLIRHLEAAVYANDAEKTCAVAKQITAYVDERNRRVQAAN